MTYGIATDCWNSRGQHEYLLIYSFKKKWPFVAPSYVAENKLVVVVVGVYLRLMENVSYFRGYTMVAILAIAY